MDWTFFLLLRLGADMISCWTLIPRCILSTLRTRQLVEVEVWRQFLIIWLSASYSARIEAGLGGYGTPHKELGTPHKKW